MTSPLRQYTTHHDIFGVWHLPNVKVRFPGSRKAWYIRTNSIGMRDDREFTPAKAPGTKRILLFGDSFAFGSGVDVENRYSNLIERRVENLEILNFGVGSTGIDRHFLIYEHLGRNYESDILMINPYLNNVARCTGTYWLYQDRGGNLIKKPKPYFTVENDQLVLHNVPVPRERPASEEVDLEGAGVDAEQHLVTRSQFGLRGRLIRDFFLHTNYKYWLIKVFPVQPYPEYESSDHPTWLLSRRILREFIDRFDKTIVLAPLPSWSIIMNPKLAAYRDRFRELHDPDSRVHVLDILPYFLELGFRDRVRCFLSKDDYHYSEVGHRVVADGLVSELKRLDLF